jgi:hypothetical protein
MGWDLYGVIEYSQEIKRHDGTLVSYAECFCGPTHFGNDSMLIRELSDARNPLPDLLSYESATALSLSVVEEIDREVVWEPLVSAERARHWVEEHKAQWLDRVGAGSERALTPVSHETKCVSHPDSYRNAGSLTLPELEVVQAEYKRWNIEEEDEVLVAPGEPLPERVTGMAGTEEDGRVRLLVAREEGVPSYWLERIIGLIKLAQEQTESEPRFVYWLR